VDLSGYLRRILTARVYEAAARFLPPPPSAAHPRQVETPLDVAKRLSERLGNTVYLKREDCQPVFSFKARRGRRLLVARLH